MVLTFCSRIYRLPHPVKKSRIQPGKRSVAKIHRLVRDPMKNVFSFICTGEIPPRINAETSTIFEQIKTGSRVANTTFCLNYNCQEFLGEGSEFFAPFGLPIWPRFLSDKSLCDQKIIVAGIKNDLELMDLCLGIDKYNNLLKISIQKWTSIFGKEKFHPHS